MFDRIKPQGRNGGSKFKKIRDWANNKDVTIRQFASNVFKESFPMRHYQMFVNVFMDRLDSIDFGTMKEPKEYGKISEKAKPAAKNDTKQNNTLPGNASDSEDTASIQKA